MVPRFITNKDILTRTVMLFLVLTCSFLLKAQQSVPFSDLLKDRFSTIMMASETETCEARSCDGLEGCDQSILDAQTTYINTSRIDLANSITKEVRVACDPGEGSGYETRTKVDVNLLSLPFKLYRVKTCQSEETYIAASYIEELSHPYEIVQELFVTNYNQRFDIVFGDAKINLDLEQLLELIFVNPRDISIAIDGHPPCGEIVCDQYCGACTHDERKRQDLLIEYLVRETEVMVISNLNYPVTLHRLCMCQGKSLWVMEEELYVFFETPYEILETVEIAGLETSVVIPDLPNNEDFVKNIEYEIREPTCEAPASGTIFIRINGFKSRLLNRYSIDGGATYQASPLFNNLSFGSFDIVVTDEKKVFQVLVDQDVLFENSCVESGDKYCSDGIDNDVDGLLDCEDTDCINNLVCKDDPLCSVLSVIGYDTRNPHLIELGYNLGVDPNRFARKLDSLELSKEFFISELDNIESAEYLLVRNVSGIIYTDTIVLPVGLIKDDIENWRSLAITKLPLLNNTHSVGKAKFKNGDQVEEIYCSLIKINTDKNSCGLAIIANGVQCNGGSKSIEITVVGGILPIEIEVVSYIPLTPDPIVLKRIQIISDQQRNTTFKIFSQGEIELYVWDRNNCATSSTLGNFDIDNYQLPNPLIILTDQPTLELSVQTVLDELLCFEGVDEFCSSWIRENGNVEGDVGSILVDKGEQVELSLTLEGIVLLEVQIVICSSLDDLNSNGNPDCLDKEESIEDCSDGIDNDGDGLIDCEDEGCQDSKSMTNLLKENDFVCLSNIIFSGPASISKEDRNKNNDPSLIQIEFEGVSTTIGELVEDITEILALTDKGIIGSIVFEDACNNQKPITEILSYSDDFSSSVSLYVNQTTNEICIKVLSTDDLLGIVDINSLLKLVAAWGSAITEEAKEFIKEVAEGWNFPLRLFLKTVEGLWDILTSDTEDLVGAITLILNVITGECETFSLDDYKFVPECLWKNCENGFGGGSLGLGYAVPPVIAGLLDCIWGTFQGVFDGIELLVAWDLRLPPSPRSLEIRMKTYKVLAYFFKLSTDVDERDQLINQISTSFNKWVDDIDELSCQGQYNYGNIICQVLDIAVGSHGTSLFDEAADVGQTLRVIINDPDLDLSPNISVLNLLEDLYARIRAKYPSLADDIISDFKDNAVVLQRFLDEEGLVKAWDIVKDLPSGIKLNTTNLEKLSRYIEIEGVDIAKLKSSLANTADAQKWIDLKLPKSDLDDIYDLIKNDPPYTHPRWTPQHKAQRWKNYETGCANGQNACLDFESWSNGFDGKIDLVTDANKAVDDYFDALGWTCLTPPCRERLIPNVTAILDGNVITGGRRLDIADVSQKVAKEYKAYSSGKVYNSLDIRREVAMDKALILSGQMNEIEWVFKGCVPSGPLNDALIDAGILIKLIP